MTEPSEVSNSDAWLYLLSLIRQLGGVFVLDSDDLDEIAESNTATLGVVALDDGRVRLTVNGLAPIVPREGTPIPASEAVLTGLIRPLIDRLGGTAVIPARQMDRSTGPFITLNHDNEIVYTVTTKAVDL